MLRHPFLVGCLCATSGQLLDSALRTGPFYQGPQYHVMRQCPLLHVAASKGFSRSLAYQGPRLLFAVEGPASPSGDIVNHKAVGKMQRCNMLVHTIGGACEA